MSLLFPGGWSDHMSLLFYILLGWSLKHMSLLFRRKMERFFLEELSAAIGWTSCERVMGIESILLTIDNDKRNKYVK